MHVLNDEVSGAEVNEAFHLLGVRKVEPLEHVAQLLFSVVLVEHIPIHSDDLVALLKLVFTVLPYHVLLEFSELAGRDIDQLIIGGGRPRGGGLSTARLRVFFLVVSSVFLSNLGALLRVWSLRNGRRGADLVCVLVELVDVVHVHLVEHLRVLPMLWLILIQVHSC